MKFIKVTGAVLSLQGCLAAMLVLQSGCRTMEYSVEPESVPPVLMTDIIPEPEPLRPYEAKKLIVDNFTPVVSVPCTRNLNSQASKPNENRRFKPTRPSSDFSNNGLLTSVNDVERFKSVSSSEFKAVSSQETSYNVRSGESLWVIAKRYNMSIDELANANGMRRDAPLKVGQKLTIPTSKSSVGPVSPAQGGTYTIAKGDTLSGIAVRFKVSVDAIKKANNMENNVIFAGKKIIIPGVSSQVIAESVPLLASKPAQLSASKEGTYRVQNGDSLSVIANRFGVTVADLMTWNSMTDARKLRAGQSLIINNQPSYIASPIQPSLKVDSSVSTSNVNVPSSEEPEEESTSFDLFEDEDLFDTSDEIPVLTVNQE